MKKLLIAVIVLGLLAICLPSLFKIMFNIGVIVVMVGVFIAGAIIHRAWISKERWCSKFNGNSNE